MIPERDATLEADLELPKIHGNAKVDEASHRLAARFELARQVIRTRAARGWTQADLAREAGTRQSRVSEIESAKGNPTLETIERVMRSLDLRISFGPAGSRVFHATMAYCPTHGEPPVHFARALRASGRRQGRIVQRASSPGHKPRQPGTFERVTGATTTAASRFRSA